MQSKDEISTNNVMLEVASKILIEQEYKENIKKINKKLDKNELKEKYNLSTYRIEHMRLVADISRFLAKRINIEDRYRYLIIMAALMHDTYKKNDEKNHAKRISLKYKQIFKINLEAGDEKILEQLLEFHSSRSIKTDTNEFDRYLVIINLSDKLSKDKQFIGYLQKKDKIKYCKNIKIIKNKLKLI